ncbi:MAG: Xaa-Pro peptidase family protein [Planctomycetales bacterium]|nr:Xaa-Pro peptidase family protein [Planctomycetales bacterium]
MRGTAGALALALLATGSAVARAQDKAEFAARRERVLKTLGEEQAVLILRGNAEADIAAHQSWRQSSDFYYLAGHDEAGAALVLNPTGRRVRDALFVPAKNPDKERWDGPRVGPGPEGAEATGFGNVLPISELDDLFPALVEDKKKFYLGGEPTKPKGPHPPEMDLFRRLREHWALIGSPKTVEIAPVGAVIHPLRLVKSPAEIAIYRRAVDITGRGLLEAMRSLEPGQNEGEAEAVIEYAFRRFGAVRCGFDTIVGSGPNSCVLHYVKNTRTMQAGEVVVLDVGAEHGYYTGDVTRTVPVSGTFSPAQREIYEIVYRAQEAAFAASRPGSTLSAVHGAARKVIEDAGFGKFFIHGTAHWIGLDVHDVGGHPFTKLAPGMIHSVEPGIYIPEGTKGVDPKYWGIGVRIEDDALVTEGGCENLSAAVPRTVEGIEALMRERGLGNLPCGEAPAKPAEPKGAGSPAGR